MINSIQWAVHPDSPHLISCWNWIDGILFSEDSLNLVQNPAALFQQVSYNFQSTLKTISMEVIHSWTPFSLLRIRQAELSSSRQNLPSAQKFSPPDTITHRCLSKKTGLQHARFCWSRCQWTASVSACFLGDPFSHHYTFNSAIVKKCFHLVWFLSTVNVIVFWKKHLDECWIWWYYHCS